MAGRYNDHLLRTKNDFLVVLPNVCLWTDLHRGRVGVLVQHMDIVIRRNPVDALGLISGDTSTHLEGLFVE